MKTAVMVNFNGNATEAIARYRKAFHLPEVEVMRYGDLPKDPNFLLSDEDQHKIMYTEFCLNGVNIGVQDLLSDMEPVKSGGMTLSITCENKEEVEDLFHALSVNGKVSMPLGETEWSQFYCAFTDEFLVNWQIMLES